jgi:hypothetical protein
MTKEEAHYGEVHFCSFCAAFQFRYGDYYCNKLEAPVAESGYCDLFEKDGKPTPEQVTVKKKNTCSNCIYNMGGMCAKTGELAKNGCSIQLQQIQIDDMIEDNDLIQIDNMIEDNECTTCINAYYNAEGTAMCRRFNEQLNMQDLTACEEYIREVNDVVTEDND